MRTITLRALTFLIVASLLLGSTVPIGAQQSDTVQVSGEVVSSPISISIPKSHVLFGAIDSFGRRQTGAISAVGFRASDLTGALWFSTTEVLVTMASPAPFSATACVSAQSNVPSRGLHLFPEFPQDVSAANDAFGKPNIHVETCGKPLRWAVLNAGEHTRSLYFGLWIRHLDRSSPFTATLTFSVSN